MAVPLGWTIESTIEDPVVVYLPRAGRMWSGTGHLAILHDRAVLLLCSSLVCQKTRPEDLARDENGEFWKVVTKLLHTPVVSGHKPEGQILVLERLET